MRKLRQQYAAAHQQQETLKRELYFPSLVGYKHRGGSDGVYMALGDFSLQSLEGTFLQFYGSAQSIVQTDVGPRALFNPPTNLRIRTIYRTNRR